MSARNLLTFLLLGYGSKMEDEMLLLSLICAQMIEKRLQLLHYLLFIVSR